MDRGDERLSARIADETSEPAPLRGQPLALSAGDVAKVGPGAERRVAGAGNDADPEFGAGFQPVERRFQADGHVR